MINEKYLPNIDATIAFYIWLRDEIRLGFWCSSCNFILLEDS
jgi:hypothetical protein